MCFHAKSHDKFVQQTTSMFNIKFISFFHNWIFHFEITYYEQIFMLTRWLNHNLVQTMWFWVLFHLSPCCCFQLSHTSHGFEVGPIIQQFIWCFNILFLNSCGTHAYLPRVAYNCLQGFMNFVDSRLPKVAKSFIDKLFNKLVQKCYGINFFKLMSFLKKIHDMYKHCPIVVFHILLGNVYNLFE